MFGRVMTAEQVKSEIEAASGKDPYILNTYPLSFSLLPAGNGGVFILLAI